MFLIIDFITFNCFLNPHQSCFAKQHSTKTLITSLYNNLASAIIHQQVSFLSLFDISAALDMVNDLNILLHRLSTWFSFAYQGTLFSSGYNLSLLLLFHL